MMSPSAMTEQYRQPPAQIMVAAIDNVMKPVTSPMSGF